MYRLPFKAKRLLEVPQTSLDGLVLIKAGCDSHEAVARSVKLWEDYRGTWHWRKFVHPMRTMEGCDNLKSSIIVQPIEFWDIVMVLKALVGDQSVFFFNELLKGIGTK